MIDNVSAGGSPTLTVGQGDASSTFSGTIQNTSGTLTLVKTGAGLLSLASSNAVAGPTTVAGGTLNLGHPLALQNSTVTVAVNNGLTFSSSSAALGGLSGSGSFALPSATLAVGGNNNNTLYQGTMSGAGGLTKTGTGTLTLTSTQSYGGPTILTSGVLKLATPLPSARPWRAIPTGSTPPTSAWPTAPR